MKLVTPSRGFLGVLLAWSLALSSAQAAPPPGDTLRTHGSGRSTLTSLTENPDGTLSIEAQQTGHLSGIGHFVGTFSYVAWVDDTAGTALLSGSGYFLTAAGDEIHLAVEIVQVGADYPRPFTGVLTVLGGTGRFADAEGTLAISGVDRASFTDAFRIGGTITTGGPGPH